MRDYNCHIRTNHAGNFRTKYSPDGALAEWDMIEIRCKKLHDDFYAAKCKSLNCNLQKFNIKKPDAVHVKSSPVFVARHLEGMPIRAKVLIPVACYCKVSN